MDFLFSSIGKKLIMAFTGLSLSLFLLVHMSGNLILFAGNDAYNAYAYALTSTPLIYVAEAGLIAVFLLHLVTAIKLHRENKAARGKNYDKVENSGRSWRSIFSSHMIVTGTLIFVFLVFHLNNFKFGTHYTTTLEGKEVRDLARLVVEEFQQPFYVILYVVAMLVVGAHIIHGVRSSFQTIGLYHTRYNSLLNWVSWGFVALVIGGFIVVPLAVFFLGVGT